MYYALVLLKTLVVSLVPGMNDGVLSFPQKKIPVSVLRSVLAEGLFITNREIET
jgi:hypothetical protein